VRPPKVNKKINPQTHSMRVFIIENLPYKVLNHLKILIPVGTAIIIVEIVK
jgi:hypothetical protein